MVCLTVMLILPSASPLSFYEKEVFVSLQRLFSVCVCVCVCVCVWLSILPFELLNFAF